jgi:hypothetical protein
MCGITLLGIEHTGKQKKVKFWSFFFFKKYLVMIPSGKQRKRTLREPRHVIAR